MTRQASRQRAERAVQLRAIGRTWQEIADTLGFRSRQAAQQAAERLGDRTPPLDIEAVRRMEDEELRIRRATLHERFFDAKRRNDDSALALLNRELDRISVRRAKLLGLDEPERSEVEMTVHRPPGEILADFKRELLASFVDAEVVETREIQK